MLVASFVEIIKRERKVVSFKRNEKIFIDKIKSAKKNRRKEIERKKVIDIKK